MPQICGANISCRTARPCRAWDSHTSAAPLILLYSNKSAAVCGNLLFRFDLRGRARASHATPRHAFLFARITLKSHRRFAFEVVGCSHLAHEVRAPAHTLDFFEAGQALHAPDTVRFILPYTLLLFVSDMPRAA
jgi:hypothetical protein